MSKKVKDIIDVTFITVGTIGGFFVTSYIVGCMICPNIYR